MPISQAERKQRQEIAVNREATGAVEVRLHHIPNWFSKRCRKWLRDRGQLPRGWDSFSIVNVFQNEIADLVDKPLGWWLDHHGSAEMGTVFVNEPYANEYHYVAARKTAEELGLVLTITDRSWWYPGHTTRFEFRLPEGEK